MSHVKNHFAKVIAVLALCCLTCCVLAGCSNDVLQIGDESSKTSFEATNKTGQAITAVAIKAESEQSFGANLEQKNDWDNDKIADIHFNELESTPDGAEQSEDNSDVVLSNLQTLRIETADGMTYEMHQLNLSDIKDATILLDGDIAYMKYISVANNEEVNTLEAEKAYREEIAAKAAAEKAAAEQAAAEKAAAEKEAAEKAASEQAAAKQSESKEGSKSSGSTASNSGSAAKQPTNNSSNSSSGSNSGSSSSGEDACVDDLVFN